MALYKKGQSGNPSGRPKGAKDKRLALREILTPNAPELIQKVVEMALSGDAAALRICIDRLIPPIRAREQHISLNGLSGTLSEQAGQIMAAIADAKLSPDEGTKLLSALTTQARLIESEELIERIERLEEEARR